MLTSLLRLATLALLLASQAQDATPELLIYCGITMVRPMSEIAQAFEKRENVKMTLAQSGSEDLYQSTRKSGVGDLYLPGEPSYRAKRLKEGLLGEVVTIGYNQMALMVQKGSPKQVKADPRELLRRDLTVILGNAESGNVGHEAKNILDSLGIYHKAIKASAFLAPDSRSLMNAVKKKEGDLTMSWRATGLFADNVATVDTIDLDPQACQAPGLAAEPADQFAQPRAGAPLHELRCRYRGPGHFPQARLPGQFQHPLAVSGRSQLVSGAKAKANVDQSLRWLIGIVLACLALVLGLKIVFADLQSELNARSVNERARLFVGEEIVHGIQGVEKDIYLMSVATNPAGYGRAYKSLNAQLAELKHDLSVLKFGGTARREVQLNLEGREAMMREATYQPDQQKQGHVMELIEIGPLLGQTRDHADELERLLALRWQAMEKEDRKTFFHVEEEIATYLKFIPPQFERFDENANRLFFDSSERLRGIELELQKQRDRLRQVEMGLVALVLVLSGLATALFVRRINQVLDHAKIEAGGLKLERIVFDFPAEIEAVMSIVTERGSVELRVAREDGRIHFGAYSDDRDRLHR